VTSVVVSLVIVTVWSAGLVQPGMSLKVTVYWPTGRFVRVVAAVLPAAVVAQWRVAFHCAPAATASGGWIVTLREPVCCT
jgi:hypothetical protein